MKSLQTIPSSMHRVRFDRPGGPEVIAIEEAAIPLPGPGQVLVKVAGAGVNRPDCLQRAGFYPPPEGASDIPGLEIAGSVIRAAADGKGPREGEAVCVLVASGGYAEYCIAEAALCLSIPLPLSPVEAAAIPETFFTVYDNLFLRGGLKAGESVLVHGGSGGIGSTAILLAKQAGAIVLTTVGSAEKAAFCLELGADRAIDHRNEDFVSEAKRSSHGRGVDVVLDMIGGPYTLRNIEALAPEGRLIQIAFQQGRRAEIDLSAIMSKRLVLTGSTLRPRSVAHKAAIAEGLRRDVWPLLEAGRIRPAIHAVFPLEQARHAHEMMEGGAHRGKIVLSMEA